MCVCVCVCESLSCVRLFVTPWTVAHQVSLSIGFSRQEYWSGLPFLSPGYLPDPGIEPWSPALQADSLPFELQEVLILYMVVYFMSVVGFKTGLPCTKPIPCHFKMG